MSPAEIIVIVVAATAGATVQGSVGIGFTLVAGPLLFMIDPAFAPGPVLIASQTVSVRHAIADRGDTDWATWRRAMFGVPVGIATGLVVLAVMSERLLALVIGVSTVIAAAALLRGASIRRRPATDVTAGAACAFASVTAGLPGPPMVLALAELEPRSLRGTAASTILVVGILATAGLAASGNFGVDEVKLSAWLVPGIATGLLCSRWTRPLAERRWFRPTVLTLALFGGLVLVLRHIS